MIIKIKKRNGEVVDFNSTKIENAIKKAIEAVGEKEYDDSILTNVISVINVPDTPAPLSIEVIQDTVENVLIDKGYIKEAKEYIKYRENRRRLRDEIEIKNESIKMIDSYLDNSDWEVNENANTTFSLQGLNHFGYSYLSKKYWLNKIYPKEIKNANENGDLHIHDLNGIACYCQGWSLYDLLLKGFRGVPGKVEASPAKHFRAALGQVVNFIYSMSGECYSDDTEIFTDKGWKLFKDLDKTEKVATLNLINNKLEFLNPERYIEKDYTGKMFNLFSENVNLLVTPNHSVLVQQYDPRHNGTRDFKLKFVKASEVNKNTNFIPNKWKWEGKEQNTFKIPAVNILTKIKNKFSVKEEKEIPMDLWLRFLGIYISEGGCYIRKDEDKRRGIPRIEYIINASQKKYVKEFREIFNEIAKYFDRSVRESKRKNGTIVFTISDKQLYYYLSQFGDSSKRFIPDFIFDLSERQINIFYYYAMLGDGDSSEKSYHQNYYTKSLKLAEDFLKLYIMMGATGTITKKTKVVGDKTFYWYSIYKHITRSRRITKIEILNYSGKVYCVETKNGTLLTRRNKKISWCGNCMGAVAFSNFDTLLAPFIYYDKLSYDEVKQSLQEFMFNMVVSTRTGFQAAFSNVTLDLKPSSVYEKRPVLIGGKLKDKTYSEFQKEMDMFNKAFFETMMEGDASKQVFTFPIPTINITKDFPWNNPALIPMWEANAKYGVCYFANYINSDMDPNDVLSMCCRLSIRKDQLKNRGGGGLFGSGDRTGSIGVVTINMPRIGYLSKTKKEYFERLKKMMDIAKDSLEMKRKVIEKMADKGLYPYTKYYLSDTKKQFGKYFTNHFSTIGLVGMNESLLNFIGKDVGTGEGVAFTLEVMNFMRETLITYQKETENLYNLEQTPAESTAYRLALNDKEKYPNIITSGSKETPYYTNSTQLPVNYTDDVFEAMKLQEEITSLYTGGSVIHIYVGERLSDIESVKSLIKKVFTKFKMPYISLTPTFSICSEHGYLNGEPEKCPQCGGNILTFSRVVGYLRPVQQFNIGKKVEYSQRKLYKL